MLHEWFVTKSKAILEDLMHEDNVLEDIEDIADAKDEVEAEKYFGDFDLNEDEESEEGEAAADLEGDVDAEVDADMDGVEGDIEDEVEGEVDSAEDRMDDLEAQLADLQAEFDRMVGATDAEDFGGETEASDDIEVDTGDADGDEMSFDVEGDDMIGEGKSYKYDDEEDDEDDVRSKKKSSQEKRSSAKSKRDIEEATEESEDEQLDEGVDLEEVGKVTMDGAKEVGDGGSIKVSTKSPIPQNKIGDRAFKGKPVENKGPTVSGFNKPDAPKLGKAEGKPAKVVNQVAKADDGMKTFKDSESNGSILKKKQSEDKGKSPVAGK